MRKQKAIPLGPPSQAKGEEKPTPFRRKGVDAQHRGDEINARGVQT
jgi:hypothetical protein